MTASPSARPKPRRRSPRRAGRPAAWRGAGEERLAVLQASPRRAAGARWPGRAWPVAGAAAARRRRRSGRRRASPSQAPSAVISARTSASVRGAEEGAHLVGQHVEHAVVATARAVSSAASKGRGAALPVDERAALLGVRRHRQHDVGDGGHRRGPRARARRRRSWPGPPRRAGRQVGRVDATDDEGADRRRCVAAARMPAVSRPGCVGQADDVPGLGDLCAGARRRRPGGHRAAGSGSAPASSAPRSPARRGTQASRAPVDVGERAARRTARRARSASRSPTRTIGAVGCAAASAGVRDLAGAAVARAREHLGLGAGRGRDAGCRRAWSRPRVAKGATAYTAVLLRRDGLAQPQEDDRRLLLGLEARRGATVVALPRGRRRSPRRRPDRWPTTCGARKSASSAECGRARKSMSLVPSDDAGELAVGVGVLDGHPAADEHADALGLAREPARRDVERLGPGGDPELAVLVADHRVGRGGRRWWRTGRPSGPCRSSTPR